MINQTADVRGMSAIVIRDCILFPVNGDDHHDITRQPTPINHGKAVIIEKVIDNHSRGLGFAGYIIITPEGRFGIAGIFVKMIYSYRDVGSTDE